MQAPRDTNGTQVLSQPAFGPSLPRRRNATLRAAIDAADGAADVEDPGLITAIIRPEKLDALIEILIDSRVHGLTVSEARGDWDRAAI